MIGQYKISKKYLKTTKQEFIILFLKIKTLKTIHVLKLWFAYQQFSSKIKLHTMEKSDLKSHERAEETPF